MKPSAWTRQAYTSLAMAAMLLATSCGGLPEIDVRPARGPVVLPAGESQSAGSVAQWQADYQRLAVDIPRAIRNCDWALLKLQVDQAQAGATSAAGDGRITAGALMPNERRIVIAASPQADGRIRIVVRAGHRGDVAAERRFLNELARVLRGKPARDYHGRFQLPD